MTRNSPWGNVTNRRGPAQGSVRPHLLPEFQLLSRSEVRCVTCSSTRRRPMPPPTCGSVIRRVVAARRWLESTSAERWPVQSLYTISTRHCWGPSGLPSLNIQHCPKSRSIILPLSSFSAKHAPDSLLPYLVLTPDFLFIHKSYICSN